MSLIQNDGWKVVVGRDKRPRKKKYPVPPDKIKKVEWFGFDFQNNERWFIETVDGHYIPIGK